MVVSLDNDFNFLVRKISKSSGIVLTGYRDSYLKRRIDLRMKSVGVDNYASYLGLLERDQREMKEVINTLTVNVTEFMRDKTPFMFFREEILPDIMERKKQCKSNMVRFWSAACSYGEEPYSIGICSKEVLPDDWSISIYATDIEEKCLKGASEGIYSKEQLKNLDPSLVTKYFEPSGEDFKIKNIRKLSIRFQKHDLTSEPPISKHFDAVFCRNVMIYFDKPTQEKLVSKYHESLRPGGHLFIGHSESLMGITHSFQYVQPTIYRKKH